MSQSISTSFVRQYEREVHEVFQRRGSMLRPAVRVRDGVVGSSTTFQKIGKGEATEKSRHGTITPMNQSHTAIQCSLSDFYAGDWVDALDEAKVNHDERMVIARGGAWGLGRKVDSQIITILDSTSISAISWTLTSAAAVRNALLLMVDGLNSRDVPNDGLRYAALTSKAWAHAMTVEEFSSADFVGSNGLPFTEGIPQFQMWKDWMGVKWTHHTGLPGAGGASAKVFCWYKDAIGYATGAHAKNVAANQAVAADIQWHNDHFSHFIVHAMSGGSCLIDTNGVIEGNLDDTAAIATS